MFRLLVASMSVVCVSHPLVLGLTLILSAALIGAFLALLRASWFFYLLVLVFLGGVIVLIIYVTTLSANEKFSRGGGQLIIVPALRVSLPLLTVPNCIYLGPRAAGELSPGLFIYDYLQLPGLTLLIAYLLLTLICVIKLVKFESGPLVKRL